MNTDTTFITNESENTLKDRFRVLIKDTRLFDVLVGFFFTSGFHAIYRSLENTERIRILVGIGTGKETLDLVKQACAAKQSSFDFSHAEVKEQYAGSVVNEMENCEDTREVEDGINKFKEWLINRKLEIKAYPSANLHAKLYIMTFAEEDKDTGRVITGSSNFTQAGLADNLEFNVELKDKADYDFALAKFNELWAEAVELKDKYLDVIENKTWPNSSITPYELYLKFLYEYFKEKINKDKETIENEDLPDNFLKLKYQEDAVIDAKTKLEEYGGVFISDVVGLGKTYISAMLAKQLDGRNLVIAPPVLLDKNSPGSWPNVFYDFGVPATKFESLGKLDILIDQGVEKYKNVFIDEAHRFRTEITQSYEKLAQICRGKRVILITATPLNNSPQDIFSQIKLFQKARKSTIPNLPDLEKFFNGLCRKLEGLDRADDYDEYVKIVGDNSRQIREKVLKYLIVRRTRGEISKYFAEDLRQQGMKFPEVADPEPVFYQLNANEDRVFTRTVVAVNKFHYSRYTPMLDYREDLTQPEDLAQKNMRKFMKILLLKRLESSFFAFRKTLARFIHSYEQFIHEFEKGNVYISKKYASKLFEFLESDDDEAIQRLIDEDKVHRYDAADFKPGLQVKLTEDLTVLRDMQALWETVDRDPKLLTFLDILSSHPVLKENKLIIFTESRETAEYLTENIRKKFPGKVLLYHGNLDATSRDQVIDNFDARAKHPANTFRILITTEVLSEGVNLHRSNVVINYDIPWNPTRLMQRVGRINRVDTKYDNIYTFNFFPTSQANSQIKLQEAAVAKIQAFIEMLGADARLLTEGEEIKSHDLFTRLTSKKTITGEDAAEQSELKYLQVIRDIRDQEPELFERLKHLPKKARTGRDYRDNFSSLLTYFRLNKLQKFYRVGLSHPEEVDFLAAARILETRKDTPRRSPEPDYYELLQKNKEAFLVATTEEDLPEMKRKGGRDSTANLLRRLKAIRRFESFTDDDEMFIKQVMKLVEEGGLPKQTAKNLEKQLSSESRPLRILAKLRLNIPVEFFKETIAEQVTPNSGNREVILSEYLIGSTSDKTHK